VRRLVEQHQSGISDYSTPIWSLLVFELWLRKLSGVNTTGSAPNVEVNERRFGITY
jgi:hypothetical protein